MTTFTPRAVCDIVGITERRLRYWRDSALFVPSACSGSGLQARYTASDIKVIAAGWSLSQHGVTTQRLRSLSGLLPAMIEAVSDASIRFN